MTPRKTALTTTKLALTPIFTALVTVATMVFVISIPATSGYFNIGETIIYVAAILFGPYVGAVAGGIGAAISDLLLAPVYAPATLIIKALEGGIVGFLAQRTLKVTHARYIGASFILVTMFASLPLFSWTIFSNAFFSGPLFHTSQLALYNGVLNSLCFTGYILVLAWAVPHLLRANTSVKLQWKMLTFILGIITGVLLIGIGSTYYSGEVQLFLGIPPPVTPTITFFVPIEFWYALGVLVIVLTTYVGFKLEPELGWLVFATFLGGLEMVAGYFLYEQFVMGRAAIVEVPVNIGQMLVGLILAIPVAKAVWRALPTLKETQQ
jgi:uncharacterized membrane protein